MSGSVSGIYIRLQIFMQDAQGRFDLQVYARNLDLLERAIQDSLRAEDGTNYQGAARSVLVERGLYPLGTEIAHPLHYVDVAADGRDPAVSPYPNVRAPGQESATCTSGSRLSDVVPARRQGGGCAGLRQ